MKALGRGLLRRLNINPYKVKIMNTPSSAEMKADSDPFFGVTCKKCFVGLPSVEINLDGDGMTQVRCENCNARTCKHPNTAFARTAWRQGELEATDKPAAPPPTSVQLLGQARDIQEQRARDYDQPGGERSMEATVKAFNIITRREGDRALSESEGWLLMQVLKDVRDRSTKKPHRDSLEDCISYAALKGEARLKESFTGTHNFGNGQAAAVAPAVTYDMLCQAATEHRDRFGVELTRSVIKQITGFEKVISVDADDYKKVYDALNAELEQD